MHVLKGVSRSLNAAVNARILSCMREARECEGDGGGQMIDVYTACCFASLPLIILAACWCFWLCWDFRRVFPLSNKIPPIAEFPVVVNRTASLSHAMLCRHCMCVVDHYPDKLIDGHNEIRNWCCFPQLGLMSYVKRVCHDAASTKQTVTFTNRAYLTSFICEKHLLCHITFFLLSPRHTTHHHWPTLSVCQLCREWFDQVIAKTKSAVLYSQCTYARL